MSQFIHIGFGNIVNTDKIIAVVSPDSAPVKRLVQKARETGNAVDATQGRRTKAVLVMENSQLILSALLPETIAARAQLPQDTQPSAEEEKRHARFNDSRKRFSGCVKAASVAAALCGGRAEWNVKR